MASFDIIIRARDQTAQAFASASRSSDTLGAKMAQTVKTVAKLGAAAGVAAAAGVVKLGADAFSTARELGELSRVAGVSGHHLGVLGELAERSGGSAEDVADAYREMQLRLSEATSLASGPAVDALRLLGLTTDDLADMPATDQFALLRDRISEVEDPANRLFAAEELLGGSSERLAAILTPTAAEFDNLTAAVEESGRVMGDDTINRLDEAGRTIDEVKDKLTVLVGEGLAYMIEGLEQAVFHVQHNAIPALQWFANTIIGAANTAKDAAVGFLRYYVEPIVFGIDTIIDGINLLAEGWNKTIGRIPGVPDIPDITFSARESLDQLVDKIDDLDIPLLEVRDFAQMAAGDMGEAMADAADLTASAWNTAAQEVAQTVQELTGLTTSAWEDAYRATSPGRGAIRGNVNRFSTLSQLTGSAGSGTVVEDVAEALEISLVPAIEDLADLTTAEATAQLDQLRRQLTAATDADGRRTLGEKRLLADVDRLIEQVADSSDDVVEALRPTLEDFADQTATEAYLQLEAMRRQYQLDADADGRRTLSEHAELARLDQMLDQLVKIDDSVRAGVQATEDSWRDNPYGSLIGDTREQNGRYYRYLPDGSQIEVGAPLPLAAGGIVTRPTNALIAETGPEAVIPLSHLRGLMGSQPMHITLELDGDVMRSVIIDTVVSAQRSGELGAI